MPSTHSTPKRYRMSKQLVAAVSVGLWLLTAPGLGNAADISVHINIPAPVVMLPAPPQMVWIPGPQVYIAYGSPHEIFFDDDRYYLYDHDAWYASVGYGGPWGHVEVSHIPPGLRKHRHAEWRDYQREAEPRYRDDDDRVHRNFVGWKDKKEKKEKHGGNKFDDRQDNDRHPHDDRRGERGHGHGHAYERDDD